MLALTTSRPETAPTRTTLTAVHGTTSTLSTPLNEAQVELLTHFAGGKFAHLLAESEQAVLLTLARSDDRLLGFLVRECSASNGCNDVGEGLRKIDSICGQLDTLYGEIDHANVSRSLASLRERGGGY